jgi:hypothetical protein
VTPASARGCRDHRRGQRVPRKLAIRGTGTRAGGVLPLDSTVVDLSRMSAAAAQSTVRADRPMPMGATPRQPVACMPASLPLGAAQQAA